MDIIQFLRTLYKNLPVLILLPIAAVLIAYVFVQNLESEYRARSVISSGFIEAQSTPGVDGRLTRDQLNFQYANLMELINSRPVFDLISYAVLKHDLDYPESRFRRFGSYYQSLDTETRRAISDSLGYHLNNYSQMNDFQGTGAKVLKLLQEQEYDFESMQRKIRINRQGQSDYIHIQVETENSQLSAFIANQFSVRFINYYRLNQDKLLDSNIEFYVAQVRSRENQLEERTARLQEFKSENSITNLYEQTRALIVQVSELEVIRQHELRNYRGALSLIDSLNNALREGSPDIREGRMADLNTRITAARRTIADLNRQRVNALVAGNDALAEELDQRIETKRAELNQSLMSYNENTIADPRISRQELITQRLVSTVEKENARQAIDLISIELERLADVIQEFARLEAILDTITREVDLAEREYLNMLDRLNQFQLMQQSLSSGSQMSLVERALPPVDPMPSKKLLIVLAVGLGTFGFALVSIFVVEYFDLTIRNAKQLANRIDKPVLGILPGLRADELDIAQLFSKTPNDKIECVTLSLIRLLRYNILSLMDGKTMLITSSQPNTGKTFITILLSYAMAQTGRKVLIIDTNTTDAQISRQFDAVPTLVPFLRMDLQLSECITETAHPNIQIIGCEHSNQTVSEIARDDKINEAMRRAEEAYDVVLIDSTPMIKQNMAREMLPFTDTVTMIFSGGEVINHVDTSIVDELNAHDISFEGVVLNNVELEEVEQIYGEIEKDRNFMHKAMKQVFRGNIKGAFRSRKKVNVTNGNARQNGNAGTGGDTKS